MGTKRKLYREVSEEVIPEETGQEEEDISVRSMLIGSMILAVLVVVAFLSPNF